MIEICLKYGKDLGVSSRSLLLIDKYNKMFATADKLNKLENDYNKRC